ncbi:RNA-guided endonuclease TnpB family protein [Neobacillus sp. PS3-12]|jgi:putative transposase|uniref:RNA-guided endonuclease TnpB family protein n=1 Tax=Neobacillus sp. PS3-12 TaxID=3070677 RepID=UPI0027DF5C13|nr:RNA-guided endonuclease TnpB family protein [Neobacillus sp. PS3-12]WML51034.1 RNA-guided endonuclease TnpB family protein [Neobacillus sp. PS3-12]
MFAAAQRGYVYRAYPTDEVKKYFLQCFGADRKMYNLHVDRLYQYMESIDYQVGNRIDTKKLKNKMPTVAEFKKMFADSDGNLYLYNVDAFACNEAKQHFYKALNEFNKIAFQKQYKKSALEQKETIGKELLFRDLKGLPKFHSKKNNDFSYTTFNQNGNIQVNGNILTLPAAQKSELKEVKVELRMHREMPKESSIKNVTVSMNANGEFFISLCVEFALEITNIENPTRLLGLDYSQSAFFVDSEGKKANYPLFMRKAEAWLKKEQKKLSRMVKGSNRWNKQRKKVAKIHIKVANQRKDWLHKKAFTLAKRYDMVILEDLDLRFLSQNPDYAKKQQDYGFGNFRLYLKFKLEQQGKIFLKAPKTFPSTQLCSNCGFKNTKLKGIENIDIREWDCPKCKCHHDRDVNSGINLKQYGEKHIREK